MIVGIDLGTTHSLIGAYKENGPVLFKNALGELLTPSIISINDDESILIGAAAKERLTTHPSHTIANFKRLMGTNQTISLGSKVLRPEELSALILKSLIADAEAATGEKITEAVISVPAYFSDAQRKATKTAGTLAGIKVERLINEPTAAALAYGLEERKQDSTFLILDLGGGTFDVSILEIFDGVVEVHASAGDNFLGGEDFLQVLLATACNDLSIEASSLSANELNLLLNKLELLKRSLTQNSVGQLSIALQNKTYQWQITEQRFAEIAEPLIQRLRKPIERAIRDAKLTPQDLDEVVLVGGASRMPLVSRLASKLLGRLPLRHINPDQTIALGAVIASGLKSRNAQLNEVILTDICPYSLGINVSKQNVQGDYISGFFMPIIPRNSTVPISRAEDMHPIHEDQEFVCFKIFQGENPIADKNILLGKLDIKLPNKLVQDRGVNIRFTYDINGILQVEATVNHTGEKKELILQQNNSTMTDDEIQARLKALSQLKIHPRDKQENILLISRASRLYEEYINYRDELQELLLNFQQILDTQDEEKITNYQNQFREILDSIEKHEEY